MTLKGTMKRLTLTNSSMETFACPYRYKLEYQLGYKSAVLHPAMDLGSTVHQLLEWHYRYGYNRAMELFGTIHSTKEVNRMKALASYELYLEKYGSRFIDPIPELQFNYPLFDIGEWEVYSAGKIDLIDLHGVQVVEFKTTSFDISLSKSDERYNFWHGIEQKMQHVNYYKAAQELGYPVDKVLYIAISTSDIKPKKGSKKHPEPETVDEYIERYKSKIDIRELPIVVTEFDIKHHAEIVSKVTREIIWNIENDIWNKRPTLCPGGEKQARCTFFAHCNFGLDLSEEDVYLKKDRMFEELDIEKETVPF